MATFRYKAKDPKGNIIAGTMESKDRKMASKQLRNQRLRVLNIAEEKETFFSRFIAYDDKGNMQLKLSSGMPKTRDLAIFTKQFAIMIERGVPLIQALSILSSQQKAEEFGKALEKVKTLVENGSTLSDALGKFPKIFDSLYVAMVRSGEISGNLDVVLLEMVKYLDKAVKLRAQIKSASIYPSMILFVAVTVTYLILVFLVPVFADQYKSMGQDLPAITQLVVDISEFLSESLMHIIVGIIIAVISYRKYRATPDGKRKTDDIFLKLPVFGDVLKKIAVSRFTSTMSTMMSSGVSILDALDICGASSGNSVVEDFIKHVKARISQGASFSEPLAEGELFPTMVVSMVAVGEQTGALDETLIKVSEIYEEEVDVAVKNMTDMFQPMLIIGIGGILGFVIIALYLPIFDQASLVGG